MEWCNEKYLDFIEDYRKSEVLWDVRNSNYKNNRVKRDVLLGLAQKYNSDEDSVKKKIKNLRSAFHREHNRLTNKKSGSGSTKESKKWFAYESLQFILDVTEPRPGTASIIVSIPSLLILTTLLSRHLAGIKVILAYISSLKNKLIDNHVGTYVLLHLFFTR